MCIYIYICKTIPMATYQLHQFIVMDGWGMPEALFSMFASSPEQFVMEQAWPGIGGSLWFSATFRSFAWDPDYI